MTGSGRSARRKPTGHANMSMVMEAAPQRRDSVKSTKRGLLVSFFWPSTGSHMTLLNTGMTRDGLFLIENGEIVARCRTSAGTNAGGQLTTSRRWPGHPMHRRATTIRHGAGPGDEARRFTMTSISPAV
jgi:hypothetical protein